MLPCCFHKAWARPVPFFKYTANTRLLYSHILVPYEEEKREIHPANLRIWRRLTNKTLAGMYVFTAAHKRNLNTARCLKYTLKILGVLLFRDSGHKRRELKCGQMTARAKRSERICPAADREMPSGTCWNTSSAVSYFSSGWKEKRGSVSLESSSIWKGLQKNRV